jgi:phospholipid/cholesterol/gamma-HCH transport system substrate-binding protein
MNPSQAPQSTQLKVGIFTLFGLFLIGAVTVYVNDKPFWWRPCQLVRINVDDATGLKNKSPIRSLGLEIGYLRSVDLAETHVTLGICVTAPVEVLPTTRAYIRGEGFLGDKFVELKPIKYLGSHADDTGNVPLDTSTPSPSTSSTSSWLDRAYQWAVPSAEADEAQADDKKPAEKGQRVIPVGEGNQDVSKLVDRVDSMVNEMTGLTNNLKNALNPEDLKKTMNQLNHALENASRTLSPEGGLNQTAQRTLAKLEDAIEQMRDMLTRVNKGEGSVGMLLNDPAYAEQIKEAINNINKLLSKVGGFRFVIDISASRLAAYDGSRGDFKLTIWPKPDHYYLIGISVDPKGRVQDEDTTTTVGGQTTFVHTETVETTGILITAMVGKVFWNRVDLAVGALYGDGAVSASLNLGPHGHEEYVRVQDDIYAREGSSLDDRLRAIVHPLPWFPTLYATGGIEAFRQVNGGVNYFYGAGITFDDEDIKLLFALR